MKIHIKSDKNCTILHVQNTLTFDFHFECLLSIHFQALPLEQALKALDRLITIIDGFTPE